ncbi:MAG TPA: DUF488 family protein [Nocardioidaceae bacterium]|nr:DUF488 family protein [Nocardioidaceae bacterium]
MGEIELRRVRDVVGESRQSPTYLVDRLWPRGVRKDGVDLDGWLKDVAPSTELRRWFHQDRSQWAEFRERYRAELDDDPEAASPLLEALRNDSVILLFDAKDRERNHAIVLREWLLEHACS